MTAVELLNKVKTGLGVNGTYQDSTITLYINEVKAFLKSSGVHESVINSDSAVGVIIRGVSDLWTLEGGSVRFSDYFNKRVIQLSLEPPIEVEDV
jgi:hypothetical protein